MNTSLRWFAASLLLLISWNRGFGQVECSGTGNLRGIRVDGDLMAFTTGIRAVVPSTPEQGRRGRGEGSGRFSREGDTITVNGSLLGGTGRRSDFGFGGRGPASSGGGRYRATFTDGAPGTVDVEIEVGSTTNISMQGVFFVITLPGADYAGGSAQLIAPASPGETPVSLVPGTNIILRGSAKGARVISPRRQMELELTAAAEFTVRNARTPGNGGIEVSFPLILGNLTNGSKARAAFTIKATGEVDRSPARIVLDASRPGRAFDGMGGNFRLQSRADAAQVQYNLEHLRVAWGRVAMPLDRWQPDEETDPMTAATNGLLNTWVRQAMEMARTLAQKKIPTVISVWSAPSWALATNAGARMGGSHVNPAKWDKLCGSIGSYLEFLKQNYGAEPLLFSFNESDMGIYVLQSPQEHAEAIKRLGSYFARRGLKTRLLLGDTGNPTGDKFIDAAAADPEAAKYIGAVSFHSWHGGTTAQYQHFSEAARQLHVPLLVCEGGLDPEAYQYRGVFLEPWYCLDEISQYVEICRVAQPLSILPWQLTADYSILTGGTDGRPLAPAQRFWQIKQLALTAADSPALPISSDNSKVVCCAFADHGNCVIHLVNNGAARTATVSGVPTEIKEMRVLVTDHRRGMEETGRAPVVQGTLQLPLDSMSFTSLVGNP
jgi:O-glycosyl hydrolase